MCKKVGLTRDKLSFGPTWLPRLSLSKTASRAWSTWPVSKCGTATTPTTGWKRFAKGLKHGG